MHTITESTRKAHVYQFGTVWHWKCGGGPGSAGDCLGGRKRTYDEAFREAEQHIADEHTIVYAIDVPLDACRWCDFVKEWHALRDGSTGLHEYRAPTAAQRDHRLRSRRRIR